MNCKIEKDKIIIILVLKSKLYIIKINTININLVNLTIFFNITFKKIFL